MKHIKTLFLLFLVFSSISFSQDFKLMTYNLRYENDKDGANNWVNRREFVLSQINYFEPDILGTQEGVVNQVKWLDENLGNYSYIGIGREGETKGEYAAVYYNDKKFKVLESNTFWLSETPLVVSKGWDAAQYRVCSYALFQELASGTQFYVFNTHFDHKGDVARAKAADLILSEIKRINTKNLSCFLMGDFNLTPEQAPIQKISKEMNESRIVCTSKPFGPEETFCDFDVCKAPEKRIDFIFTGKEGITVTKYATIVNVQKVHYPSDHYPVLINCTIKK